MQHLPSPERQRERERETEREGGRERGGRERHRMSERRGDKQLASAAWNRTDSTKTRLNDVSLGANVHFWQSLPIDKPGCFLR